MTALVQGGKLEAEVTIQMSANKSVKLSTTLMAMMLTAGTLLAGCSFQSNSFLNGNHIVGSGTAATESRKVSDFSAVAMYGSGQLIVNQGDVEALTITADDNLLPYLTSDVQNGKLSLSTKPNTAINNRVPIVYHLTVTKLDGLESLGSGSTEVTGIATDKLSISAKGSGNVHVAGKVTSQEVSLLGSGDYNAENLASRQASVQSFGSGSVTVRVSDSLNVKLTGSGSVGYFGDPSVTKTIFGSGKVYKH